MADLNDFEAQLRKMLAQPRLSAQQLHNWIDRLAPVVIGPSVTALTPLSGPPGTMITITGKHFSDKRWKNDVTINGRAALVVRASTTELKAIVAYGTTTGPIKVEVDAKTAAAPLDFEVLDFPKAGSGSDGPPIFFGGAGSGGQPQAGVDPIGSPKALVVICYATDRVPTNPAAVRSAIQAEFNNAIPYYDEVSYGRTTLDLDYTNWVALGGAYNDYVDASIQNIDNPNGLSRIVAEAAQGAVDQSLNLDDYVAMGVVLFLDGDLIRAWGGWSSSNFSYSDSSTSINLSTSSPLGLLAIGDNADWGRFAHEVAHNFVDPGAVLGEDIYGSDLVDASVASASNFDLLGNHDSHPCFSAHFMAQLGYWNASNVIDVDWDRNPFSQTYTLQAHGSIENTSSSRAHAIRINVGTGLQYYIEVREKNDPASRSYDTNIPVGPAGGGVIVTKVFTDRVNINQEMRLVTLLHDPITQETGAIIEDPLRALTITVGSVQSNNPLVISVDVAWAQTIGANPEGTFDLEMSQTGVSWRSDDIWVDRQPWGLTPETVDGNTVATIEKPRPGEINRLFGQVRCNGADAATNVKLTYYAITPPGVGDNGAWAPIGSKTIANISANGSGDTAINWTPTVGEHTCLKVAASAQFGEVSATNNSVQENVFHFAAPAGSPPDAVMVDFAIRNPLNDKAIIPIEAIGVPEGYVVHVPHRWVVIEPLGQRTLTLTVLPVHDIANYRHLKSSKRSELAPTAWVNIVGRAMHTYRDKLPITDVPGFRHLPIGGFAASVTPKYKAEIRLNKDQGDRDMYLSGTVNPASPNQRVTIAVRPEGGQPMLIDALTDAGGLFWVRIPLKALQGDAKPWEAGLKNGGKFESWAETTYSDTWAPARSESCFFEFEQKR